MVGIVFFFEDHEVNFGSGFIDASLDRWVYSSRFLGATHYFAIDKSRYKLLNYYQHGDGSTTFRVFNSLEEVEKENPQATFLYLENAKTLDKAGYPYTSIIDFKHPEGDAIYVVGPDFGGITLLPNRKDKTWLTIPVGDLWAEHAMVMCLYDRMVKAKK